MNPDRPPKGIVGDLPNVNQEDIFGDDSDDDGGEDDDGEANAVGGGGGGGLKGGKLIENVLHEVSSFINRGAEIGDDFVPIARELFDSSNPHPSLERKIYILE